MNGSTSRANPSKSSFASAARGRKYRIESAASSSCSSMDDLSCEPVSPTLIEARPQTDAGVCSYLPNNSAHPTLLPAHRKSRKRREGRGKAGRDAPGTAWAAADAEHVEEADEVVYVQHGRGGTDVAVGVRVAHRIGVEETHKVVDVEAGLDGAAVAVGVAGRRV